MALKQEKKKKQQAPANKETKNTRPWPNLPHQLIDLIESQLTLEQGINFGSVTKSWRAAPKKCNPNATLPWLQISDTNTSNIDQQQRTMTKRYNSYELYPQGFWWLTIRNQSRYPWKHYLGCTNGIFVTYGAIHSIYFL